MFLGTIRILLCFASCASVAFATVKDPTYDEVEGLDLVEALIRDGKLDIARKELKAMKPSDRFWMVSGHLEMAAEKWSAAASHYEKSVLQPARQLHLARAVKALVDFKRCSQLFSESAELWLNKEADIIAKSECEYKSQRFELAWQTLKQGRAKKDSFPLLREQVALKLELNLVREALTTALAESSVRSINELLSLAELFNDKKFSMEALTLVEMARQRSPLDLDANLSAAQIFFQRGDLHSTVEAFERAAKTDPKFNYHAAEMHRQLGHQERATFYSQFIPEDKKRLKTRMAIYVEKGRYPLIASMESVIARSELKDDDEMKYAMAYALLRQGDLSKSLKHLSRIVKPELQEKAALLKKAALDCQKGTCQL